MMSTTSRAIILALGLDLVAASKPYEWKGVFLTPETTYKWGAQKKNGKYADPAMKMAAIPTSAATEAALTSATAKGEAALKLSSCPAVMDGGKITPAENKCFKLTFDQAKSQTLFEVDATGVGAIAFFAEHVPTEFEDNAHYFKDKSGVDIEPVAQDPKGGAAHSHGHGGDSFEGKCVCQAKKNGWKLDCKQKQPVTDAVAVLKANAACKKASPPQSPCINNYYILQAHHDHCLHDQLPTGVEKDLHDYEHFYKDCYIKRQFDASLFACKTVDCSNAKLLTESIAYLQASCAGTKCASDDKCKTSIQVVLMAHDTCPEDKLPNNLETALHDFEDNCAKQLCNSAQAAFDPYDEKCSAGGSEGATSAAFGGKNALSMMTSALSLSMIFAVMLG